MFVKIKGHLVNLANVNHIERNGEDVVFWFNRGGSMEAFNVNWKKLNRRLKRYRFSSLLPSTSKK